MQNTYFTNVADVAVSNYGVAYLNKSLASFAAIGVNASPNAEKPGATIKVYYANSASAVATFNGTYTPSNPNLEGKSIGLKHLVATFALYDADVMDGEGVSSQFQQIANVYLDSLAVAANTEILNPFTASANAGTNTSLSASLWSYNALVTMSLNAGTANWPKDGQNNLILTPTAYSKIVVELKDNYHIQEAASNGTVARAAGFNLIESTNIPGAGGAGTTIGLAFRPGGAALAMRPVLVDALGNKSDISQAVLTTETGLPFTYKSWFEPIYGKRIFVFETQVGSVALDKNRVMRLENLG
jgi:hypothetical protein